MSVVSCELLLNFIDFAEINIFNLNNRIQINRLNWIHHVERMKREGIPKLMDYTPRGTGSIGRPNLCWKGQHVLQRNGTDPKVQTLLPLMFIKILY
jgi:hypothetical protein